MHGHHHQYHLPAPVDDADKTILDNKVGHGYCYLDLFHEDTMDRYNWPQYPTVRQVVNFEQDLRDNEVRFNIGQYCKGRLWHISKVHGGDCDWAMLDQWAEDHKEHIDNIVVGTQLFTWTANLTNTLVSAIFSWNQVFTSNAPQVTQDVPKYEHPMPQQLAEQVAVETQYWLE